MVSRRPTSHPSAICLWPIKISINTFDKIREILNIFVPTSHPSEICLWPIKISINTFDKIWKQRLKHPSTIPFFWFSLFLYRESCYLYLYFCLYLYCICKWICTNLSHPSGICLWPIKRLPALGIAVNQTNWLFLRANIFPQTQLLLPKQNLVTEDIIDITVPVIVIFEKDLIGSIYSQSNKLIVSACEHFSSVTTFTPGAKSCHWGHNWYHSSSDCDFWKNLIGSIYLQSNRWIVSACNFFPKPQVLL